MRYDLWRKRFTIGTIILFIGASVLPSVGGNFLEAKERTLVTSINTTLTTTIQQCPIKSLYKNGEMPVWKIGDSWVYKLSCHGKIEESDEEISVNVSIGHLNYEVIDESSDFYHLMVKGEIDGDLIIRLEGFPNIKGSLKNTEIVGTCSIAQATLGIEELNIQIDGRLSLIGFIPIPLDIDLDISFNPSYHPLSFPLDEGNEWHVNSSTINIQGRIAMPGITQLFPAIPDEIPIDIKDYTIGNIRAYCVGKESVEVIAGEYTAYNISFDDRTTVYYADTAGNFIRLVPSLEDFGILELDFDYELVSTTYIDPGAPNVPSKPAGQTKGKPRTEYTYSSSTTDPQGDQIYYLFNWGDDSNSGWLGPYNSGVTCEAKHTWIAKDNYNIKVKAKDIYGRESAWSDPLPITMPYSYNPMQHFIERLFERFPTTLPLLRQLIG